VPRSARDREKTHSRQVLLMRITALGLIKAGDQSFAT